MGFLFSPFHSEKKKLEDFKSRAKPKRKFPGNGDLDYLHDCQGAQRVAKVISPHSAWAHTSGTGFLSKLKLWYFSILEEFQDGSYKASHDWNLKIVLLHFPPNPKTCFFSPFELFHSIHAFKRFSPLAFPIIIIPFTLKWNIKTNWGILQFTLYFFLYSLYLNPFRLWLSFHFLRTTAK